MVRGHHDPLLALLASRAGLGETFATEAIGVVLREERLRRAFVDLLARELGMDLGGVTAVRTEVHHDAFGRTDIECQSANGRPLVVVEAKIGAPLSDGQIARYIALQRDEVRDLETGLVLLVPVSLVERVRQQSRRVLASELPPRRVAVISWDQVLDELEAAAGQLPQGVLSFSADLAQLRGLIRVRTRETVAPLGSAAVGPAWESRSEELAELVDFVSARLAAQLGCERGPRVNRKFTFGPARYLEARGPVPRTFFAIGLNTQFAAQGQTPLWLRFNPKTGGGAALAILRPRLRESTYAHLWRSDGRCIWIPISLDPVLRDEALVDDCERQAMGALVALGIGSVTDPEVGSNA